VVAVRELLVGRDAELGFLQDRLAAARAGVGQVVLVCGAAGIGKTRLAEELAARAGDAQVGWGAALDDAGADRRRPGGLSRDTGTSLWADS
jgi:transcriptional regulator with AAA-type ATPase domain